jgi:NodT family efflux transporter outer membrane factor (OMF) lipoprotein
MKRLALLGAAALVGCTTVGPDYRQPDVPIPARFAEADAGAALSGAELGAWWQAFGDSALDMLVGRSMAHNLDVKAAAARIAEARALETVAGAASQPQVNTQGSVTRLRISEHAIPVLPGAGAGGGTFGLPGTEFTTFRAGFDASWEIDLFGRTQRSIEAASAQSGAALWNRRDIQVSVAAEVAENYLALRTLQARIAIAETELARHRRFERLVAARVRGGLVTGEDLELQRSELSTAAAALPALRARMKARTHALGVLTGDTPEALITELGSPAALPPSPPAIPAGLPSELLRRRPDIRAAERELAASSADIGVAIADLYPRISLTAAPSLVSTALGSLLEWGSRGFSAGVGVDWPLFNGGRTRGNIAAADARQEQALIAYRKTVLRALQDVEDALSLTDGDRRQLAELDRALSNAARAEDLARIRYRGGLVTLSDVLLNQARRVKLEDEVMETKGALARDSVALFKALGGGWPELGAQP